MEGWSWKVEDSGGGHQEALLWEAPGAEPPPHSLTGGGSPGFHLGSWMREVGGAKSHILPWRRGL